ATVGILAAPSMSTAPEAAIAGDVRPEDLRAWAATRPQSKIQNPKSKMARPLPLRPRGGFGGYLHGLRVERGLTIRHLATAAGVHHTYISKLERRDRQAPD